MARGVEDADPYGSVQGMRRGGALPLPRATARVAPTEGLQEAWEKNPPVTASPCQPLLGKGAERTGVRIATTSLRTGLAMTPLTRGAVQTRAGGQRRPPLRILCNTNFCNKKGMPVRASLLRFYAGAIALARVCAYSISRRFDCLASWVTLGRISSRTPLSYLAFMLAVSMPATLKLRL